MNNRIKLYVIFAFCLGCRPINIQKSDYFLYELSILYHEDAIVRDYCLIKTSSQANYYRGVYLFNNNLLDLRPFGYEDQVTLDNDSLRLAVVQSLDSTKGIIRKGEIDYYPVKNRLFYKFIGNYKVPIPARYQKNRNYITQTVPVYVITGIDRKN